MAPEIEKAFIQDVKEAYQDSKEVSKYEREYLSELLKELDKIQNLEDKVDCLLYNGVRYIGEGSYWNELERAFPKFVNLALKQEE